jgi:hypothetical protein
MKKVVELLEECELGKPGKFAVCDKADAVSLIANGQAREVGLDEYAEFRATRKGTAVEDERQKLINEDTLPDFTE